MWEKQLLLSIVLLGLIDGFELESKEEKCNYVVMVSPVMKSGDTGQICLIVESEESVEVDVTFEYQSISIPVFSYQISPNKILECQTIDVPKVDTIQLAYLTISVTGQTVEKKERKSVAIDTMPEACAFQTEKNIYAPGDMLRFRYICFDYDMKPIQPQCDTIYLVDPNGARVEQMQNPGAENYMISGEFKLSAVATTGSYRIDCMKDDGGTDSTYCTVQQYTLPRFDSQVICPSALTVTDKVAEIKVSAQYVYGKPLNGTIFGKCSRSVAYASLRTRNCMKGLEDISIEFNSNLDSGAWTEILNLDAFRMQYSEYDSNIQCTVTVKEIGTGVLDTKYCYMYITKQPANLQFDYTMNYQYYRHGLDLPIALTLTNEKEEAIPNKNLTIEVDGEEINTLTTDEKGRAEYGIDTTKYNKPNITIRACYPDEDQCYASDQSSPRIFHRFGPISPYPNNPEYPCTEILVYRTFSETDSYLQIKKKSFQLTCSESNSVEVEFIVSEDAVGKSNQPMTVYHMVTSKQTFVFYNQTDVDMTSSRKGSFFIDLDVNSNYGPEAQLLVFAFMKTEIISDNWQLNINPCSSNEVSLTSTPSEVAPGSIVTQELTAAPGSICGIRGWDASLNLLGYYNPFTYNSLLSLVQYYVYGYQVKDFDFEDPTPPCEDPNTIMFCHGRYVQRTSSPTDGDTYNNVRSSNVLFFTNLMKMKPQVCGMEQIDNPPSPIFFKTVNGLVSASAESGGGNAGAAPFSTVRTKFNDVFSWGTLVVGPDGKGSKTTTLPDTISKFNSDALCISKEAGVGVSSEPAKITTFLPFFVEPTMPKYCIRGETVEVIITVANYLDKCAQVNLSIELSAEFELESASDDGVICVCNGERASKTYSVTFRSLGNVKVAVFAATTKISDSCAGENDDSESPRIDTVIINMNVVAEGIQREDVISHMNLVNGSSIEHNATIAIPENLVDDTSTISLIVTGNTVGLMAAHLDNLLRQPAGCCEQMLAQILPLYFIRKYLEFEGIIDDKVNERAKSLFCSGYSSMLSCRRWDGRYSLFPGSDTVNSWVLVKTYFAFDKMKEENCYIDDSVQQQALEQLGKLQNLTTGCLTPTEPFLTTPDDKNIEMLFTAYAAAHLKQCTLYGIGKPILDGAMNCLQNTDPESLDTYTVSYVLYAAALCGLNVTWDKASTTLKGRAINTGGTTHWTNDNFPLTTTQYVPSSVVDMTAIALMGFMLGPGMDMDYIGPIAAWLTSCMNSRGGFPSSQDTMSATQAMTKYALLVYVKNSDCVVVASQGDIVLAEISVTESNKMLVQRQSLDVTSGTITITTNGTCAALVQIVHDYNTQVKNDDSSFSLTVNTRTDSCPGGVAYLLYTDMCIRYTGMESRTNMVYMAVKSLTGYEMDIGSLYQLQTDNKVSNVGFGDNVVYLYWSSMVAFVEHCFTFTSYMENRVPYRMNSTVYAADYYNTGETASAVYSYSCSTAKPEVN